MKLSWSNTPKNQIILIKAVKKYRPYAAKHGYKDDVWTKGVQEVNRFADNTITNQTAKEVFHRLYASYSEENPQEGEFSSGIVTLDSSVSAEMQVVATDYNEYLRGKDLTKQKRESQLKKKAENYSTGMEMLQLSMKKMKNRAHDRGIENLENAGNQMTPLSASSSNLLISVNSSTIEPPSVGLENTPLVENKKRKLSKVKIMDYYKSNHPKSTEIGERHVRIKKNAIENGKRVDGTKTKK